MNETQQDELASYVVGYARSTAGQQPVPLIGVVFSYFRFAFILVLTGMAACGVWLIPALMVGQGFLLAFSVRCFAVAMGRNGVLLALSAFGIRCLFILPCCFYLATLSWANAARLRQSGRKIGGKTEERAGLFPLLFCAVVLAIGCIVELSIVPKLLSLALDRIT